MVSETVECYEKGEKQRARAMMSDVEPNREVRFDAIDQLYL